MTTYHAQAGDTAIRQRPVVRPVRRSVIASLMRSSAKRSVIRLARSSRPRGRGGRSRECRAPAARPAERSGEDPAEMQRQCVDRCLLPRGRHTDQDCAARGPRWPRTPARSRAGCRCSPPPRPLRPRRRSRRARQPLTPPRVTCVAPSRCASSSRLACRSMATIGSAPASTAACTTLNPTPPRPRRRPTPRRAPGIVDDDAGAVVTAQPRSGRSEREVRVDARHRFSDTTACSSNVVTQPAFTRPAHPYRQGGGA